jgi:PAS domain S-box-containing protein
MREHFEQNGVGYAIAITVTVAVAAFRLSLADWLGEVAPFLPFVLAVMLSGWYCGLGPGLLATVLSAFCGVFFFTPPHHTLRIEQAAEMAGLLLFVCTGVAISWVCESMHNARRQLSLRFSREQRQKEIAEAWQARYEAAVKASRSVLYDSNRQTGEVLYGGDCESILGYTADELNGDMSRWVALIHPEDRQIFLKEVARTDSDGSAYRADYRMIRKDGQIVWMRDDGHFAMHGCDTLIRIVGFVRNVTDQRRAEQERNRLQEQLTRLVDHTPLAVVEWDAAFSITRWAGQAEKVFGWASQEIIGKRFDDLRFFYEEDLRQVEAAMQQLGDPLNTCVVCHNRNYRKCGEIISCEWYNSVLHDDSGKMVAVLSLVLDITERERSSNALLESEMRFRHLADAVPQVVWIADSEGTVSYYNSRIERFSGVDRDADGCWKWQPVVHPDDLDQTVKAWSAAVDTGTLYQCEHRVRMTDGSYRWHLSRGLPVVGLQGQVQWFGTATDVHDLKTSQFALQESQERFQAFMDSSPALAWAKDEYGRYVYLNRAYEERFGVRLQDWLGRTDFDVWPEEAACLYRDNDEKALQAAAPVEAIEESIDLDGRQCVWWSFKFVYSDGTGTRYVGGIAYDVTEQKKTEAQLKHLAARLADADQRKDHFLATLAHELRNPLAPIRTGIEVLKLANDEPKIVAEICSTIERQTKQLISLVDDLLDVSRITRGKLKLRKCRVTLSDVVRSAIEIASPAINDMQQELSVELPEQVIQLEADPHRLAQVVSNLLLNASSYTASRGHIRLSAERQGSNVLVTVRDDGIGVPADMHQRIFEMFAQIEDRSLEKGHKGLGIGLTLVKSLVEMHGGRVEVHSEGKNRGSEFRVLLPILMEAASDGQHLNADDIAAASGNAVRVLVVDDNTAAVEMLSMFIKMLGNDVRTAYDGEQAIEAAAEFLPDIILMDIGMPRMNGYEAAQHIRQQPWGRAMMLVALTGWGKDEDKRRTKEAGFDHHLVKPAEPAELQRLFTLVGQRTRAL